MNDPTGPETGALPRPVRRWPYAGVVLIALLALWGIASRVLDHRALAREADIAAVPSVAVRVPDHAEAAESLVLPATVMPYVEAPIYARTSGYLRAWHADLGSRVKKGQLLAEIDAPEIDQQLRQATADLALAEANAELARTTNERWKDLLRTSSVSQQDADAKAGDALAKRAAVDSARANLARLRELESFKRVVAPFDGVVIQRSTDVARVALRSAVPDGPLNLARIDAERCPPVVVARTEAVVRVSVGASGQERSEAEG